MKYETPNMEILIFGMDDIIRTSTLTEEGAGDGPEVGDGGWS